MGALKSQLEQLVQAAVRQLAGEFLPEPPTASQIGVERTRDAQHGDFTSNVALRFAKAARKNPREFAQAIIAALPPNPLIARAEAPGPGFINFHLTPNAFGRELSAIHEIGERYGRSGLGQGVKVLVEFVSAPTDAPSHLNGGREAAYSAALAGLLTATGFDVRLERYGPSLLDGDSALSVAHHQEKRAHGFERLIDVSCVNHQSHFAQLRAALEAMGEHSDALEVQLVQPARFLRGGPKPAEVSNDACTFFYLLRSHDQPLEFDLELAQSRTNENPVYYVQYAHARVTSVLKQLAARRLDFNRAEGLDNAKALTTEHEQPLLRMLTCYPEIVERATISRAPHLVVHYLRELAHAFHTYYNAEQLIVPESKVRNARFALALGVQQVIRNGLTLLGVSSPATV